MVNRRNDRLILARPVEADPHPELPVERGPGDAGVGSWVHTEKHTYLATYIDAARGAANSRKFDHWVFIDPFCAAGRVQVKGEDFTRPGGAMVAWRQSQISGAPFTRVLVGDLEHSRVTACASRLLAATAPVTSYVGPAHETVPQMVRDIPQRSLCLAYLDPYNLALLQHPIIAALAQLPCVDFVVNFSTMDLLRNADAELDPERARFDDVSPGWRQRLQSGSKSTLAERFMNDWQQQIAALGFRFSQAMPMARNTRQHEIYKLVFFARHDLPMKLWGDVARDDNLALF